MNSEGMGFYSRVGQHLNGYGSYKLFKSFLKEKFSFSLNCEGWGSIQEWGCIQADTVYHSAIFWVVQTR